MGLLDQAAEALKNAIQSSISAPDAAAFDDPVALKTEWKPLTPGGANFRTHKLADDGAGGIRFVPTVGYRLFGLVFLALGLGLALPSLVALKPLASIFGLIFAAAGVFLLWPRKKRFDASTRSCTLGETETPFGSIHAVQLLREWVSGDSSYYSYELNLVLKDGSRLNVVDHASLVALRDDADRVAACIGCKVWDGIAAPQLKQR